jgi:hypothetical protein
VSLPEHDSEQRHAAYCNRRPCRRLGDGCNGEPGGEVQSRDEVGVDRGARGGVVLAYRATAQVHHEEVVARQRECVGSVQPRDEACVNRGARGGVVFAKIVSKVVPISMMQKGLLLFGFATCALATLASRPISRQDDYSGWRWIPL